MLSLFPVNVSLFDAYVLLIIGAMLKALPFWKDWLIPWALLLLSVLGACSMIGWTADGVIQGVLVAGAAVYGNQLWKQTTEQD